jgi:crotonobetainyl-CoA:carnitine CoA-transferase CaiB-like acyl-CoA transferase
VGIWAEAAGEGNRPIRAFGNEDHYNGLLGAAAILLGLIDRERGGEGVAIEAPQLHSSVFATSHVVRRDGAVVPTLPGLDHGQYGRSAYDRIYLCASGWIAVYCETADHEAALRAALGLDGAGSADAAVIGERLAARKADEWRPVLDDRGVPCEVVREESWEPMVFDDPALEAAGIVTSVEHPSWGPIGSLALLFHLSGTPGVVRGRAPLIGEHSREVLAELGYSASTIEEWIRDGVVREEHV